MDKKEIEEKYNVERRRKELERYIGEIEKYNHNIRKEYNAFKSKKDAFLFIYIIKTNDPQRPKDPIKIKIFVFENQNSHLQVLEKEDAKQVENGWKDLLKLLKNKNIGEIRKCGDFFYEKLLGNKLILPSILSNERNGTGGIWISCAVAIIDPIWEWLCPKCSNGEGFFWGDEFSIVRIPENCDFKESNFRIGKVAILEDEKCPLWAEKEYDHLKSKTGVAPEEIFLNNNKRLKDLNDFNCIHVVVDAEHKELVGTVQSAFEDKEELDVLDFNEANNQKILFLNILNTCIGCSLRGKLIELIPAKTWIHPILAVSEDFASKFTESFYECVVKEKNVAKALRKAREKIQKCDDVDDCKKFYRFAYVACGNPYTQITWNDD